MAPASNSSIGQLRSLNNAVPLVHLWGGYAIVARFLAMNRVD